MLPKSTWQKVIFSPSVSLPSRSTVNSLLSISRPTYPISLPSLSHKHTYTHTLYFPLFRNGYTFLRADALKAHSLAGGAEEALHVSFRRAVALPSHPKHPYLCPFVAMATVTALSWATIIYLFLRLQLPQPSHLCPCLSSVPPSPLLTTARQIVLIGKADYVLPRLSLSIASSGLRIKAMILKDGT